jgi:CDP-glucose 4,6-dehydratase
MRILVTGHTGFKGSWLCLILKTLGHEVYGIALDPLKNGVFELASVGEICNSDIRLDIRGKKALDAEIVRLQPEVVLHLAAQALVLSSYEQVYETYATNISGTLNVLDSSLKSDNLKGIVVVTTDKVYENNGKKVFVETDPLGGKDPYSSSKALADKLTQDWSKQNSSVPVGIARAGNVIGGGDVSPNRLIPDILKAIQENQVPLIRNPKSVRPWQHVLDCLNGYLQLMDYVQSGHSGVFNFGPASKEFYAVEDVVKYFGEHLKIKSWKVLDTTDKLESNYLALDSSKAFKTLQWENKLSFEKSLDLTLDLYLATLGSKNLREVFLCQVESFLRA